METNRANIVVHRSDGETFLIDDRPFGLIELEGVDSPKVEIFVEKNAVGDGDVITGSRVASRNITFKAKSRGGVKNAILRRMAETFFDPLFTYDVDISYDGTTRTARDCKIAGISIPSGSLYVPLEITVTFYCPYGYLDGEGGMDGVDLNSITPRFSWPFVSMEKYGFLFGVYNFDKTVTINNRGNAPTWIRGEFTALGPGTVQNVKLIHGDSFVKVLYTMNPGDIVVIDTEKKMVRINGVNALNKIDKASSFGGMRIDPGYSVIGFDADANPDQLSARVYFQIRYLGV